MHTQTTKVIDIRIAAVDAAADRYALLIIFKCDHCGHEYGIGDDDQQAFQAFADSITAGNPSRNIACPMCAPAASDN